jgi:hypothetical protein
MSSVKIVSGPGAQPACPFEIQKNRVTIARQKALLCAGLESLRLQGMFEIAHAVQKMTGS